MSAQAAGEPTRIPPTSPTTPTSSTSSFVSHELWRRVRRRRISQIARFGTPSLRELCVRFGGAGRRRRRRDSSSTHNNDATVEELSRYKRFELATYLAGVLEEHYEASVDASLANDQRRRHLATMREMCAAMDETFCRAVTTRLRRDDAANANAEEGDETHDAATISTTTTSNTTTSNTTSSSVPATIVDASSSSSSVEHVAPPQAEASHDQEKRTNSSSSSSSSSVSERVREEERRLRELQQQREEEVRRLKELQERELRKLQELQRRREERQRHVAQDAEHRAREPLPRDVVVVRLRGGPSGALAPRKDGAVTFDRSKQVLPPWAKRRVDDRLREWEPFWRVVRDLSVGPGGTGLRVAPAESATCDGARTTAPTRGAARWTFATRPTDGVPYGTADADAGERRLLLRAAPVVPPPAPRKPDGHAWPKGTHVQLDGAPVPGVAQRRQQAHDETSWKGMCHALDLTARIVAGPPDRERVLEIAACERDDDGDDRGVHAFQLAVCERRSAADLKRDFLARCDDPDDDVADHPYEAAAARARRYASAQTVRLDDDDADDDDADDSAAQRFQLNCPISMRPIVVPVRGRKCKHVQCYDLDSFLDTNAFPSGRRWRCVCCDEAVSVDSLVRCGLFAAMIQKRSEDDKNRYLVEFRGDGTWTLQDETKTYDDTTLRGSRKRRRAAPTDVDLDVDEPARRPPAVEEIVLCDD